ncbi:hypothetical protein SESBI_19000 [Sesbania bispinosa]|nr:hypothetical protein SESBI_19000 [Sesbania bispinosa]
MARLGTLLVLFMVVLFAPLSSSTQGRMLHLGEDKDIKKVDPSSRNTLFLSSLPKGTVPSSTPSKKGHSVGVDKKLVARHLITTERLLYDLFPALP